MGAGPLWRRSRRPELFSQAGGRAESRGGCASRGGATRPAWLVAAPTGAAPARPRRRDPRELARRSHGAALALRSGKNVSENSPEGTVNLASETGGKRDG